MHNLHLSLTEFRNESRVLKQTNSLLRHGLFQSVTIVSLHAKGLAHHEILGTSRQLFRLAIKSRILPACLPFQILKYFEYCARVVWLAARKRPSVVNAHALSLLPLGILLKLIFGSILVYDPHELETEVEGLQGLRQKLSRLMERVCIRAVSLTITVGPAIRDWYLERYQLDNVVAVLNCPPLMEIKPPGRLREELGIDPQQSICLYQGALCVGRGIELLLESFEQAEDDNTLLVCMGYGELADEIKRVATRCPRIFYFPAVSTSSILNYTVSANVGLVLTGLDDQLCLNNQYCLPNKLFEYAMAGIPIVCSPMSEMSRLLLEYKIGALIDDASPISLRRSLTAVNSMDRDSLRLHFDEFNRRFNWEEQEKVMINAYQNYIFKRV